MLYIISFLGYVFGDGMYRSSGLENFLSWENKENIFS